MSKYHTEKPKNVDYFQMPTPLWKRIKKVLPKQSKKRRRGRPPADNRARVERDLVCIVDGLPMESRSQGLVWRIE